MAVRFVRTSRGEYVNLERVELARLKKKDIYELVANGEVIGECHEFDVTIVETVQVGGQWMCLTLSMPDDEHPDDKYSAEPVIAWGCTADGTLRPITPAEDGGVEGTYWLMRVGEPHVWGNGNLAGWANIDDWLADVWKPETSDALIAANAR